jgi:peptide/nickel transport system substrate-binding protein
MIETYDRAPSDKGGQAAGPGRAELVRNPQFREWSGAAQPNGCPDRISIDTGLSQAQAVRRVAQGRSDAVWEELTTDQVPELQTRYPAHVHTAASLTTRYIYLNTTLPPFNNRDVRRAVAYAMDRRVMSSDSNASRTREVTCQVLPPDFPGYDPYCPCTLPGGGRGEWTAPDFREAERLVRASGTKGARVAVATYPETRTTDQQIVELLVSLGYRASLRAIPFDDPFYAADPNHHVQAGITGWGANFPGEASFLPSLVTSQARKPGKGWNVSHFCDPTIDAQIDQALKQQTVDPAGATALWAAADQAVVDEAPIVPLSNEPRYDFVSPRVGNYQHHPHYGQLPAQMWVQ